MMNGKSSDRFLRRNLAAYLLFFANRIGVCSFSAQILIIKTRVSLADKSPECCHTILLSQLASFCWRCCHIRLPQSVAYVVCAALTEMHLYFVFEN